MRLWITSYVGLYHAPHSGTTILFWSETSWGLEFYAELTFSSITGNTHVSRKHGYLSGYKRGYPYPYPSPSHLPIIRVQRKFASLSLSIPILFHSIFILFISRPFVKYTIPGKVKHQITKLHQITRYTLKEGCIFAIKRGKKGNPGLNLFHSLRSFLINLFYIPDNEYSILSNGFIQFGNLKLTISVILFYT